MISLEDISWNNVWGQFKVQLKSTFSSLVTKINSEITELNNSINNKTESAFGTYVGDGEESRFVDVGFTPTAVIIYNDTGEQCEYRGTTYYYYGGIATYSNPLTYEGYPIIKIEENGFRVFKSSRSDLCVYTNLGSVKYYFQAYKSRELTL